MSKNEATLLCPKLRYWMISGTSKSIKAQLTMSLTEVLRIRKSPRLVQILFLLVNSAIVNWINPH
jgi:hypothetical protein